MIGLPILLDCSESKGCRDELGDLLPRYVEADSRGYERRRCGAYSFLWHRFGERSESAAVEAAGWAWVKPAVRNAPSYRRTR
ncbi:hypothetical protein Lfu02_55400 [Longispora fulva]|uniref:Uncharacterized protein n=1 Tax=Longispora fulva TaxID=619741 RepID=A0A8J7KX80_9ACTN|nr:hypothetical protein [Longispora fulva]GIG61168.1 hypothetical protein Lfu02_55400 [Longispora fulva]